MARVLCLHGLGGTGATMWPLVAHLGSCGHQVLAPTLPGHGSRPEDLLDVGWEDWVNAALEWPADAVVGQSMGGALALAVAAAGACQAVVAINPVAPDPDALDGLEWRRSRGHEWTSDVTVAQGEVAYNRLPLAALVAMSAGVMTIDLAAVTQPVLLVSSCSPCDAAVTPRRSAPIGCGWRGPWRPSWRSRRGTELPARLNREPRAATEREDAATASNAPESVMSWPEPLRSD